MSCQLATPSAAPLCAAPYVELGNAWMKRRLRTPARVALSWIPHRPGVASTIIGARTLKQFEVNLAALDLELSSRHVDELDKLTAPRLNFLFHFLENALAFGSSGTVINGVEAPPNPMAPQNERDRF
jgi:hypothetical protein